MNTELPRALASWRAAVPAGKWAPEKNTGSVRRSHPLAGEGVAPIARSRPCAGTIGAEHRSPPGARQRNPAGRIRKPRGFVISSEASRRGFTLSRRDRSARRSA